MLNMLKQDKQLPSRIIKCNTWKIKGIRGQKAGREKKNKVVAAVPASSEIPVTYLTRAVFLRAMQYIIW